MLGVGAETVIIVSYFMGDPRRRCRRKGGKIRPADDPGCCARVLSLIVSSGAVITLIHLLGGQSTIVLQPAFIFKCGCSSGVLVFGAVMVEREPYSHFFWEGLLGANWYALFALHILAPVTDWVDLLVLYAIWSVGFLLVWMAVMHWLRTPKTVSIKTEKVIAPAKPVEKKAPPPAPVVKENPKPVAPSPPAVVIHPAPPKPPAPPVPIKHAPLPVAAHAELMAPGSCYAREAGPAKNPSRLSPPSPMP